MGDRTGKAWLPAAADRKWRMQTRQRKRKKGLFYLPSRFFFFCVTGWSERNSKINDLRRVTCTDVQIPGCSNSSNISWPFSPWWTREDQANRKMFSDKQMSKGFTLLFFNKSWQCDSFQTWICIITAIVYRWNAMLDLNLKKNTLTSDCIIDDDAAVSILFLIQCISLKIKITEKENLSNKCF